MLHLHNTTYILLLHISHTLHSIHTKYTTYIHYTMLFSIHYLHNTMLYYTHVYAIHIYTYTILYTILYQIDLFVVAELAPDRLLAFKPDHAPLETYGLAS